MGKIKRILSYCVLLIIVILAVVFATENATSVKFHYYFGDLDISLSLLLIYALGLGILLGIFASLLTYLKQKRQIHLLKNKLKQLEQ